MLSTLRLGQPLVLQVPRILKAKAEVDPGWRVMHEMREMEFPEVGVIPNACTPEPSVMVVLLVQEEGVPGCAAVGVRGSAADNANADIGRNRDARAPSARPGWDNDRVAVNRSMRRSVDDCVYTVSAAVGGREGTWAHTQMSAKARKQTTDKKANANRFMMTSSPKCTSRVSAAGSP